MKSGVKVRRQHFDGLSRDSARGQEMNITVEAIYESGVLRPLEPLDKLKEHELVRITVQALSLDTEQRGQHIKINSAVARDR